MNASSPMPLVTYSGGPIQYTPFEVQSPSMTGFYTARFILTISKTQETLQRLLQKFGFFTIG